MPTRRGDVAAAVLAACAWMGGCGDGFYDRDRALLGPTLDAPDGSGRELGGAGEDARPPDVSADVGADGGMAGSDGAAPTCPSAAPEPITSMNMTGDTAGLTENASSVDLLQGRAAACSPRPAYDVIHGAVVSSGATSLTDGEAGATDAADASGVYLPLTYGTAGHLPFTITFNLDTAASPNGYDILKVNSFAGWYTHGRTLADQRFELWVRQVGSAAYSRVGAFTFAPFSAAMGEGPATTLVSVVAGPCPLATAVDSVSFIFRPAGQPALDAVDGLVVKELDVFGAPTK